MSDQHLIGTEGNDFLEGADGNDWLEGLAGDDFLLGAGGNDLLDGGAGSDELFGNQGDDVYVLQAGGADKVYEFLGDDEVRWQGVSPDQVERIRPASWSGGNTNDLVLRIAGTTDTLTLSGYFYDPVNQVERVVFDDGTVWTAAQLTDLRYLGTAGNDFLGGTEWSERLEGFGGSDNLYGAQGDDVFVLDAGGFDIVGDGGGNDEVHWRGVLVDQVERIREEGSFNLTLRVAGTTDTLVLNLWFWDANMQIERVVFDDGTVWGVEELGPVDPGPGELTGTEGDDLLAGTPGVDYVMYGLAGNDTYIVDSAGDVAVELPDEGIDVVRSSMNQYVLASNIENLELLAEWGTGNELNNTLIGNDGANGLDGGVGADLMIGGAGDDVYFVDNFLDVVQEEAGGGVDTVYSLLSYTLPDEVETLLLQDGFFSTIDGTGNSAANVLIGNSAANVLDGRAGADQMSGQGGDDIYIVDDVGDVVTELLLSGFDSVDSSLTYTLGANLERLVLTGTAAINGTGNALSNVIIGNDAANILDGGAATDTLAGRGGDDTYFIESGDHVSELAGGGIDSVVISSSYALQANFENLMLAGAAAVNGTGNALANTITGNAAANVLSGGDGHDRLDGGAGADTLIGGTGDDIYFVDAQGDVVLESAGEGIDTVVNAFYLDDLHYYPLPTNVENMQLAGSAKWASGNSLDNELRANALLSSILYGWEGADTLYGGAGHDDLDGGTGADIMIGGEGSDTYRVDSTADVVIEEGIENFSWDGVSSSVSFTLSAKIETLGLTGWDEINGTGNALDNVIIGNSAANVIDGGAGNDLINGAWGSDHLRGGTGHDTYLHQAGNGADYIEDLALPGEGNRLRFTPDVALAQVRLRADANGLYLEIGSNGDALRFSHFSLDPAAMRSVETYEFIDGPTFSHNQLIALLNTAPLLANPLADVTVPEDGAVNFQLPATAFSDTTPTDALTYTATRADGSALPSWLTFDAATRSFSGVPANADVGSFLARVTATDRVGVSVSDTFAITVENVNDAPTLANALADQSAQEDGAFSFTVPANTFSDIDAGDALTLSATLADGSVLPSWLSFDAATRTFSGTPLNGDVGPISVRVTATDGSNASVSDTFDLSVANTNDAPTVANAIADQTAQDEVAFSFSVPENAFSDVDASDTLTYSAALSDGAALPGWLAFNAATRTFEGTPPPAAAGTLTVRVTATDGDGLSASDDFDLTVLYDGIITGTDEADSISGTAGDDAIFGLAGDDSLYALEGDDVLDGGTGTDTMVGGAGNDLYRVDDFGDVVVELAGEGVDTIESSWLSYGLSDAVENLTLVGEAVSGQGNDLNNIITGNDLGNGLGGGAGDDVLIGGGGDDYLLDMVGNDRFIGGEGNDLMVGQDGNDIYEPGPGSNSVYDSGGDDELRMPTGVTPDQVSRIREGDNLILRSSPATTPPWPEVGGPYEQVLISQWFLEPERQIERIVFDGGTVWTPAEASALRRLGSAGNDVINGNEYDERIEGRDGDDVLSGGGGADVLVGGTGADTYVFDALDGAGNTASITAGDRVYLPGLSRSSVLMTRDAANLCITVIDTGASIVLQSASGSPGEEGWRTTIEFGDGSVWSTENIVNTSPYIGTNGNDVLDGSEFGDQIFGVGGDDVIHGNDGNDVLYGGAGDDTLYGGAGDDYYVVADAGDVLIEGASQGTDQVESSVSLSLAANLENLFLTGTAVSGSGNDLANVLVGNAAANILAGNGGNDILTGLDGDDVLDGGFGADTLHGGAGNDLYRVDDSGDRIFEDAGGGIDTVESSAVVFTLSSTLENLTLTGTAAIGNGNDSENILVGNAGDNTLYGYGGNDALSGMGEDDLLFGGAGNDQLLGGDGWDSLYGDLGDDVLDGGAGQDGMQGGAGNDTYHFSRGSGFDTAWEFLGTAADTDVVLLGADIAVADISVEYTPSTQQFFNDGGFLLRVTGTSDVLKLIWSPTTGADLEIEEVRFANGTVWTEATLVAKAIENGEAPVLAAALADQAASEDSPFAYTLPGDAFTDADIAIGDSLAYSAVLADGSALPTWLAFDAITRTFSGTPANGDVGSISVRVTATDESGRSASDVFDLAVANTNDAPIVAAPLADQGATEDAAFSFTVPADAFADVDAGDSLAYSASLVNGDPLPSWLSFDAGTRTFSGTPLNGDVGTISVRVTATDGSSASVSDTFDLSVANTNDAPTVAAPLIDQAATEDSAFSFTLPVGAFADVDAGDTLSYSAAPANGQPMPSWLAFDAETRTFSGTPLNGDVGTFSIRVTATDGAGAFASDVFDIVVANTNDAPTLANAIADQNAQDTVAFDFTVPAGTFADIDPLDVLTYSTGVLPAWLSFNAATRTFTGTPGAANLGVTSVEVRATDSVGAVVSDVFNITVAAAPDQTITGTSGNNTLVGGSGNDTINGLGGADNMTGNLGNDTYFVDNTGDQVNEAAGGGIDTVNSSISYTLGQNVENLTLTGTANRSGTGNALDNILTGNSGTNTLTGGDGNDTLDGKGGADSMTGGTGNDTYYVDNTGDTVTEVAGASEDLVYSSISRTSALWSNVEALVLIGTANLNAIGNTGANVLRGNSGDNTLGGASMSGSDILEGGAGDDSLTDTSGSGLFNGGAGTDTITGGSGRDFYIGGTGNDTINTGSGTDLIAFNLGDGQDVVNASSASDNALSLGGALHYDELRLSRTTTDLTLSVSATDSITFRNWYSSTGAEIAPSILNLQVIAEAMADFDAGSSDPLLNRKVQQFRFDELVDDFNALGLSSWTLSSAVLQDYLQSSSDTHALGGDLAYRYGRDGTLAGVGAGFAYTVFGASDLTTAPQILWNDSIVKAGAIRLS